VISRRAAATIWNDPAGSTVLGKRLVLEPSGPAYTIVGVVGDVRDTSLTTPAIAEIYVPQEPGIDRVTRHL
jgi:hypothetical protein